uniref:Uncharacterized protein n=1 Tax=Mus musculus TaxID=10090 RepID=Q8BR98_MOUSE|nr:unnamed protein product [Mus musculus]
MAVLTQRAAARSFGPGLGGECPRGRVSGCPRVPSSFARPELSCSRRPERRGRAVLSGPRGGRQCPARGCARHKVLCAVRPGHPDHRPFPLQADPPEPVPTAQPCCCLGHKRRYVPALIGGRPWPRGREDGGSRPVFVELRRASPVALSCALLRLSQYFKRLTQKGKGTLHKTQRGKLHLLFGSCLESQMNQKLHLKLECAHFRFWRLLGSDIGF